MRTKSDNTVFLVLDGFGKLGRAYVETDERDANKETIVDNMITGQYTSPLRVVAFNVAEGWARDVSKEIALAVIEKAHSEGRHPSESAIDFLKMFEIAA
jgi:hypothetical protein